MDHINKVFIVGSVARDPELKSIPTKYGPKSNCKVTIASVTKILNPEGQEIQHTCYVDVPFWGEEAERHAYALKKGSEVQVEGRLSLESWTDKTTQEKRFKHVIKADKITYVDKVQSPKQQAVPQPQPAVKHPRINPAPQTGQQYPRRQESDFDDMPF